jgi:hypothetical protein
MNAQEKRIICNCLFSRIFDMFFLNRRKMQFEGAHQLDEHFMNMLIQIIIHSSL